MDNTNTTEDPPGPTPPPLPRRSHPVALLVVSVVVQALGAGLLALLILLNALRDPDEGLAVAMAAYVTVALPAGIAVGFLAGRMETLRTGRILPSRGLWVPLGSAVALVAHWAPLLPWTPLMVAAAVLGPSHRFDDGLESAAYGLLAWLLCAVGVGLAVPAWRKLKQRDPENGAVPAEPPKLPSQLGFAVLVGAWSLPPTGVWVAVVEDMNGRDLPALLLSWVGALIVGVAVIIAVVRFVLGGVPRVRRPWLRAAELGGWAGAAMGWLAFGAAMLPVWGNDKEQQIGVVTVAFVAVLATTALASMSRVRRARSPLEVEAAPAGG